MEGYWTKGLLDYQEAFTQGKAANRAFKFALDVMIPDINKFVDDSNHSTVVKGTITFSDGTGGDILNGSYVRLFDGEVQNYTMYMHYFLVFSFQGKTYHLDGVKNILGNDCVHLLPMMTTLYSRVRAGDKPNTGDVLTTGIVIIEGKNLNDFVFSFRGYNTNFFGFLINIEKLLKFALKQIKDDCTHLAAYTNEFWYIWSSTGTNAYLLDLIKRPSSLEIRFDLYKKDSSPVVNKQYPPISTYKKFGNTVAMGDTVLSRTICQGKTESSQLSLQYETETDHMEFTPGWLNKLTRGLLPNVVSHYGTIQSGTVDQLPYANQSITYTSYTIPIGISFWRWSMISSPRFENTDLMIETMSLYLGGQWVPSSFVRYKSSTHRLNNPLLSQTKLINAGAEVVDGKRTFAIEIHVLLGIHIQVKCSAPENAFAVLEHEGATTIHTTVLGECTAHDLKNDRTFKSNSALLEIKH
jgi:hypothetical protein